MASAHRLSREFAGLVSPAASAPGPLLGLEHEFSLAHLGRPFDFRRLIDDLVEDGARLDPGDRNARRRPDGSAVTCDGPEAEVATPPIRLASGFACALDCWSDSCTNGLLALLPPGFRMAGYSTHISVSAPAGLGGRIALLAARTFGPALLAACCHADSAGIWLRPRPGRVEICGDHLDGPRLQVAAALWAGAVLACTDALREGRPQLRGLPPVVVPTARPAAERSGLYLSPDGYGESAAARGRSALIRRAGGGWVSLQEHFEASAGAAAGSLENHCGGADLAWLWRSADGTLPLAVESPSHPLVSPRRSLPVPPPGLDASLLTPSRRPGFDVAAVLVTWDYAVYRFSTPDRGAYGCVPRSGLRSFLTLLEHGSIDDVVGRYLQATATGRVLRRWEQTRRPGLYDRIGAPGALLPEDPGVTASVDVSRPSPAAPPPGADPGRTGGTEGAVSADEEPARRGKGRSQPAPARGPDRHPRPWWVLFLLGLGGLLVLIVALLGGRPGGHQGRPASTPTASSPATEPTPTVAAPIVWGNSARTIDVRPGPGCQTTIAWTMRIQDGARYSGQTAEVALYGPDFPDRPHRTYVVGPDGTFEVLMEARLCFTGSRQGVALVSVNGNTNLLPSTESTING